jgi:hypothetical protein
LLWRSIANCTLMQMWHNGMLLYRGHRHSLNIGIILCDLSAVVYRLLSADSLYILEVPNCKNVIMLLWLVVWLKSNFFRNDGCVCLTKWNAMDLSKCHFRDLNVWHPEQEFEQPLLLAGLEWCWGAEWREIEVHVTLGKTSLIMDYKVLTFKNEFKYFYTYSF